MKRQPSVHDLAHLAAVLSPFDQDRSKAVRAALDLWTEAADQLEANQSARPAGMEFDSEDKRLTCERIIELVQQGYSTCSEISAALQLSKAAVSKHASYAIHRGWLAKSGRKYRPVTPEPI
jgi:response regulator of citrate/malate metabolism